MAGLRAPQGDCTRELADAEYQRCRHRGRSQQDNVLGPKRPFRRRCCHEERLEVVLVFRILLGTGWSDSK